MEYQARIDKLNEELYDKNQEILQLKRDRYINRHKQCVGKTMLVHEGKRQNSYYIAKSFDGDKLNGVFVHTAKDDVNVFKQSHTFSDSDKIKFVELDVILLIKRLL